METIPSSPALALTGVAKHFGDVRAVDGLSLTAAAGGAIALLGPNGAGKSTTVSLLLGLARPTAGTVRVLGGTPEQAVAQGRVGAMLQQGELMPELTIGELVGFVRGLYPRPLPLSEILDLADLGSLVKRRAKGLSGGQAQRVRFALAVAGAPDLLVLDEPTAAMDVESRRRFWDGMRAYAAGGRTVLFATHYLEEADQNADRVLVIARGRLAADGTPAEIKATAGGRLVTFRLGDQPAAGLDALPGVTSVEIRDGVARLRTDDAALTTAALYRGTTLEVHDLEVSGGHLEDAFLALTRES
ncbi:ABC transporter ATP-binding protein [Nonomuraea sp. SMC257]|uniref:ABC transporter ATP-binding protein n=1 Tax=Nonomuraea montanisoli TaxID=2741721 RepID=A0A7Y6IF91_9ACTN|nr:ABC transporter ATP-binding protein [Nonomuraea montanisoli]NUW37199.1 ABC transporter ATP-binding protein [Nonomuraea montanisoli]